MPSENSSPPPPSTVGHIKEAWRGRRDHDHFINDDHYMIFLALRPIRYRLTGDGKRLCEEILTPGTMRTQSPGEHVRVSVRTPAEAATVHVPGPVLREMVKSVNGHHRPGAVSCFDPLLNTYPQVAHICRVPLRHTGFDAAHAPLFVGGTQPDAAGVSATRSRPSPPGPRRSEWIDRSGFRQGGGLRGRVHPRRAHHENRAAAGALWATELQISASEFNQCFRTATGFSPHAWDMHRRIDRAKELLLPTKNSVSEVSLTISFSSQSHFTEAFRHRAGTSPAWWREQQRAKADRPADSSR